MNLLNQVSESIVMRAEELHKLRYRPLVGDSMRIHSRANSIHPDHVMYSEGVDFIVDYESGTIRRTAASSIPDWSKHPLCGKSDFDHSDYPSITNQTYTIYADYQHYDPTAAAEAAADVIGQAPDLVTIGYGMNDQNKQPNGANAISPEQYKQNISAMVEGIQQHTESDIVLITPCLPNPLWKYASPNVTDYADKLRELGFKYQIGVADLQRIWLDELAAGKTHESLLINNVNHPNGYGHSLYALALNSLLSSN
ncbi:SGNH/GDSL hydrolase family protein [Paenibacillus sp. TAF58]